MDEGLSFPYIVTGDGMERPQLPLTLALGTQSLVSYGLLDTGADVNVLPYSIGMALGAMWEEQRRVASMSGNLGRYEARGLVLNATIGDFRPILLAFAWTQTDDVPLLLGQVNFFAEFDVCFYRSQSAFEVRPKRSV